MTFEDEVTIGIGMPVYNGERYLEETLDAHLSQTCGDFHLLIADNASTDRTREICLDYSARDKRIKYVRNSTNVGAARNYTVCFAPFRTQYFRWANADDKPHPTLLAKCLEAIEQNPDAVLVYGRSQLINEHGDFLEDYEDDLDLRDERASERFRACFHRAKMNNVLYGLMRRALVARTALMGAFTGSDINLLTELSLYGKFIEVPDRLFQRRLHPQASSWDKDTERQRAFWDPSSRKLILQSYRSLYAHTRAVVRAPISLAEKRELLMFVSKVAWWSRQEMVKDVEDLISHGLLKRT